MKMKHAGMTGSRGVEACARDDSLILCYKVEDTYGMRLLR